MKHRKLKNSELGRPSPSEYQKKSKSNVIIVLDNVRSLNNVGSVFRTAEALMVNKIYLCGITATPPHKDIQKTALGATESVEWEYRKDTLELVQELKNSGVFVVSVEQAENAQMLDEFEVDTTLTYALVFGNEVKGVQQDVVSSSNTVIEIPQFGTKHSFNISVSVGVVLWDLFSKMKSS
ncbi:MAG: RNA methyltransferase [Flavobacteriaceae bacterium]|nr:RNA methyltransferase [Flavobacteriaceae bacterium]